MKLKCLLIWFSSESGQPSENNLSPNKDPPSPSRDEENLSSVKSDLSFRSLLDNNENVPKTGTSLDISHDRGSFRSNSVESEDWTKSSDYSTPDKELQNFMTDLGKSFSSDTHSNNKSDKTQEEETKVCVYRLFFEVPGSLAKYLNILKILK